MSGWVKALVPAACVALGAGWWLLRAAPPPVRDHEGTTPGYGDQGLRPRGTPPVAPAKGAGVGAQGDAPAVAWRDAEGTLDMGAAWAALEGGDLEPEVAAQLEREVRQVVVTRLDQASQRARDAVDAWAEEKGLKDESSAVAYDALDEMDALMAKARLQVEQGTLAPAEALGILERAQQVGKKGVGMAAGGPLPEEVDAAFRPEPVPGMDAEVPNPFEGEPLDWVPAKRNP